MAEKTVKQIDSEIETQERLIASGYPDKTTELRSKFIAETVDRFTKWAHGTVEGAVLNQTAKTQQIGGEGLHSLKKTRDEYLSTLPDRLRESLDRDDILPHIGSSHASRVGKNAGQYSFTPPSHINAALIPFVNEMRALPRSAGYESKDYVPKGNGEDLWNDQMRALYRQYQSQFENVEGARHFLKGLKVDRERAVVREMWEQA